LLFVFICFWNFSWLFFICGKSVERPDTCTSDRTSRCLHCLYDYTTFCLFFCSLLLIQSNQSNWLYTLLPKVLSNYY